MSKRKGTHGGKRDGAGRPRKPDAKLSISCRVSPEVHAYLISTSDVGGVIDAMVRRTVLYRKHAKGE